MVEILLMIALSPQSCVEPCSTKASISIAGYEPSRMVCVQLRDVELDPVDEPSRRSCWPWSGRSVTEVTFSRIPAGIYEVSVTLEGGQRATQTLRVGGESRWESR